MRVRHCTAAVLVLLALTLGLAACGSGSVPYVPPADTEGDEPDDEVTPPEEPPALDGAVLWTALACGGCHAADGTGGFGPDLTCYPADGLLAYLTPAETPHVAGAQETMIPEEALALATFLAGAGCTGNVPASHTLPMGTGGILHRSGHDTPETSCTPCHGPLLEGYGTVPSCASCHEGGGAPGCTSCHANAQDDGDGVPTSGRRAVMGEFALTSHHGPAKPTDDDCRTCHEMTKHKAGSVRLYDVDDTSTVIVLTDDPASDETEAAKLEAFCLACHDSDAANGSAPFSDGVTPTAIDATAWEASAHVGGDVTCAGDGTSYGCHSTKHGSAYAAILHDSYVVTDPNERTNGDYDACWGCHSKQTILFSDDAFDEYHKKHVVDEDTACAVCHNPHGSYDSSERGLISFERAVAEGWITFSGVTTLSSSFRTSSTGGNCSLRCHNEMHGSESYRAAGN